MTELTSSWGPDKLLSFLAIWLVCLAVIRSLRIRTGDVLFFGGIIAASRLTNVEVGVSLIDNLVVQWSTLDLFVLAVGVRAVSLCLSVRLMDLPGACLDGFRHPAAAGAFLALLTPASTSPNRGMALLDDALETDSPADRRALWAWWRLALGFLWPASFLAPVIVHTMMEYGDPGVAARDLLSATIIWLAAGVLLLGRLRQLRVPRRNGLQPLALHTFTALFSLAAFLQFGLRGLAIGLISLAVALLLIDGQCRRQSKVILQNMQWTRWAMLAAGVALWHGLFAELTLNDHDTSLGLSLVHHLVAHDTVALSLIVAAAVLGFVSASPAFSVLALLPVLTHLPPQHSGVWIAGLGAVWLGVVISPEHLMRARPGDRPDPALARSTLRLLPSVVLAAAGFWYLS